eukprot:11182205-Lingulodinium_polyedra.AAC.1
MAVLRPDASGCRDHGQAGAEMDRGHPARHRGHVGRPQCLQLPRPAEGARGDAEALPSHGANDSADVAGGRQILAAARRPRDRLERDPRRRRGVAGQRRQQPHLLRDPGGRVAPEPRASSRAEPARPVLRRRRDPRRRQHPGGAGARQPDQGGVGGDRARAQRGQVQ